MPDHFTVVIVGSGPGGLSAGVAAAKKRMSHLVLERAGHLNDTISKYQKGKKVMANPPGLKLRANLRFEESIRETILDSWEGRAAQVGVNVRLNQDVTAITHAEGDAFPEPRFTITIKDQPAVTADNIVLAIGQGVPRMLDVPGKDREWVQYQLNDPSEYHDERIVVLGAGDAGIENALGLAEHGNDVTIVNNKPEFVCQPGNLTAINRAVETGKIKAIHSSAAARVDDDGVVLNPGERKVLCNRIIARIGAIPARPFVERCCVIFPSKDAAAVPELSPSYMTNVPGLYVIGSLGGYSLIKQAINQGYEVIQTIAGTPVPPADEEILTKRFADAFPEVPVAKVLDYLRAHVPMLEGLTVLQLREAMLNSSIHRVKKATVIYRRNDYTSSLYNIAEGEVGIVLDAAHPDRLIKLPPGEFFGESSLVSGRRRSGTVVATEDSVLVEIPRRTVLRLEISVAAVRQVIDRTMVRRIVCNKLGSGMLTPQIEPVIECAELQTFAKTDKNPDGDILIREGDDADALYIIRSGSVRIERQDPDGQTQDLDYVGAGGMVGERGVLTPGARRSATVRATIATEAIRVDAEVIRPYLAAHPELGARFRQEVQQQIANLVRVETQRGQERNRTAEDSHISAFLFSEGLGEATNALIIDESLCVGCDNCEKACAGTHGGISRLDRAAGKTVAAVHVPIACRHCEHPHCMTDCPVDAIAREPTGEVTIADTCIACNKCVENCPYHVIKLAYVDGPRVDDFVEDSCAACSDRRESCPHHNIDPSGAALSAEQLAAEPAECLGTRWSVKHVAEPERAAQQMPGFFGWLKASLGLGDGSPSGHGQHKKQAVKCDLCAGIANGPACVRACPTGAAWRGPPEAYLAMIREGVFRRTV